MKTIVFSFSFLLVITSVACKNQPESNNEQVKMEQQLDTATFGAGCFWCVEAVFLELNGVELVESGYMGGKIKNPSYKEVCAGTTGHAEVCRIIYDSEIISFDKLLEVFFMTHDPTSLNKQGNDIGTQYRSVIFYHSEEQQGMAEYYKNKLTDEMIYPQPIVTEISPAVDYYKAEEYHQDYYNNNKTQPYCNFVITPKLEKFRKIFENDLK